MFDSLHEECGVFGVFENQTTTVAQTAYLALFALQHRGQESCGIAVNDDGVFRHHRGDGLVPDVFSKEQLACAAISCGLPENIRGEQLSISDFAALSKALRRIQL